MEELINGSIIKLFDEKKYLVVDTCRIESVQYVVLINIDNENSNEEEVFILKNCVTKNNKYYVASISEEEFDRVVNYYKDLYTELGVFDGKEFNMVKIYDIYNTDKELVEKAKLRIEEKIKNENMSKKSIRSYGKRKKSNRKI